MRKLDVSKVRLLATRQATMEACACKKSGEQFCSRPKACGADDKRTGFEQIFFVKDMTSVLRSDFRFFRNDDAVATDDQRIDMLYLRLLRGPAENASGGS